MNRCFVSRDYALLINPAGISAIGREAGNLLLLGFICDPPRRAGYSSEMKEIRMAITGNTAKLLVYYIFVARRWTYRE
jgi:hypothetical protein